MTARSIIGSIAAGLIAWTLPATTASVPDPQPVPTPILAQAQSNETAKDAGNGNSGSATGRVDCRNAAAQVVEQSGGQLLSVRLASGQCVITILVPGSGDNARPRKMTVQVSR